jgi:hypothetical protein
VLLEVSWLNVLVKDGDKPWDPVAVAVAVGVGDIVMLGESAALEEVALLVEVELGLTLAVVVVMVVNVSTNEADWLAEDAKVSERL